MTAIIRSEIFGLPYTMGEGHIEVTPYQSSCTYPICILSNSVPLGRLFTIFRSTTTLLLCFISSSSKYSMVLSNAASYMENRNFRIVMISAELQLTITEIQQYFESNVDVIEVWIVNGLVKSLSDGEWI